MLDAPCSEIFPFFKTGRVFLLQKRRRLLGELRRRKTGLHGIIVMGGDRIEFVIMAAGALQRVREEGFADTVRHIIEKALSRDLRHFHAREFPWSHA